MNMNSEAPVQNNPPKAKKWILPIAGAFIALCVCVAAATVIIIPKIMNIWQSVSTYSGIADEQLKADTLQAIASAEQTNYGCDSVSLFRGSMLLSPDKTDDGSWVEIWQILACGESHMYSITFTPDGVGGTYFSVSRMDHQ
jgi:hypothetical protein